MQLAHDDILQTAPNELLARTEDFWTNETSDIIHVQPSLIWLCPARRGDGSSQTTGETIFP